MTEHTQTKTEAMPDWALDKKDWASGEIRSSAKSSVYVLWGFTIFWNLVSATPFLGEKNVLHEIPNNPPAALVFLFPLIGLVMLAFCIKVTRQWRRFGATPLKLDPFPGAIGGHIGGTLRLNIPYDRLARYEVTVSCRRSSISGSGKERRRKESILWQSESFCHQTRCAKGTELSFRFDIPAEKAESESDKQESYILWKLSINATLEGPDFQREFVIPVFNTAQTSSIKDSSENHPLIQEAADEGIYSVAKIEQLASGIKAYFPAFQRPTMGINLLVFGIIFVAAGLFSGKMGAPMLFPIVFSVVGSAIVFGGIFYLAKSLEVKVSTQGVESRRFLFGYPVTTRNISKETLKGIDIKQTGSMQSGTKNTVYYQVIAHSHAKKKVIVAERLTKRAEAERLLEMYQTYLG
jgi:hypothetical protein